MKKDNEITEKAEFPKENLFSKIKKHPYMFEIAFVLIILAITGTFYYLNLLESRVYIEKSEINAPIISIGTLTPGILDEINVEIGDYILKNKVVAVVSGDPIISHSRGIVVEVNNVPGQILTNQNYIVKIVDPEELRVIGRVEEDKGLSEIHPGERVEFTVDAYGSTKYSGVVEKVVPTSRQSDIVFSISDKREKKEFDIIVKFDYRDYPELKNGMSAKMWIYKD